MITLALKDERQQKEEANLEFQQAVQKSEDAIKHQKFLYSLKIKLFDSIQERLNALKSQKLDVIDDSGLTDMRELLGVYRKETEELRV